MKTGLARWIRIVFCALALLASWTTFTPTVEAGGQACLLAYFAGAPIYDCVCGGNSCYAYCGKPGPNDPCLDGGAF